MANNITSANAIYKISIPLLSIINYQLQQFSADSAFTTDEIEVTQNLIGVDGIKSSGFTPQMYVQNIMLQADSSSILVFETLYQSMVLAKDVFIIDGIIELSSVSKTYILGNGTLQNYKPVPDAQRVLQPQQFTINWGIIGVLPT